MIFEEEKNRKRIEVKLYNLRSQGVENLYIMAKLKTKLFCNGVWYIYDLYGSTHHQIP
jgi:hypothetical protein